MRLLILTLLGMLLVGCAGQETRSDEKPDLDSYMAHAGESENRVHFRRLTSWQVVGDQWVLLEAAHRDHFLVKVDANCARDLEFARSLSVRQASRINTLSRLDEVYVGDRRCSIREIRKFDRDAFREARGSAR